MPVALRPFQAELERRVHEAWNQGALNVMPVAANLKKNNRHAT